MFKVTCDNFPLTTRDTQAEARALVARYRRLFPLAVFMIERA